jgi:DNA-binding CsgD family transcriptional regulator
MNRGQAVRDAEMLRLRGEGLSLDAIARRVPRDGRVLTKQAVSLALQKMTTRGEAVPTIRGRSVDRMNRHTAGTQRRRAEAERLFGEGVHIEGIAAALDVDPKTVRCYLRGIPTYRDAMRWALRLPRRSRISCEEMRSLRASGLDVSTIAARAGLSRIRVYQVLQEGRRSR